MNALKRHLPAVAVLAALNAWICRRLFTLEYLDQFGSIDGAFISIARYLSRHWGGHSWWPLWHCGMPYEDTYVPLFHLMVAALATVSRISAAHAYHIVVAIAYSVGPVTLYLMAVYLGAARGNAFLSAFIYSLFSPSTLLVPAIAQDTGGFLFNRRLQVLTVYGEGPHITAMTVLPLAIAALSYSLLKKTGRSFALAAIALALVFLINVPGTLATGLAVFCWIVVQPAGRRRGAWMVAGAAAIAAYAVACFGIPPSSELTVLRNMGPMHKGFADAAKVAPILLVLLLGATAALGYLLSRSRLPLLVSFAALYFGLTAILVITDNRQKFELLPQASRLQLEMEMAACLIVGAGLWLVYARAQWRVRIVLVLLFATGAGYQMRQFRRSADRDIRPADLAAHSERASALWADAHLAGERVYVTGSASAWWNVFTETPQVIGCCEQGVSQQIVAGVPYLIDPATGPYHELLIKAYLQVLGAQAIVISGPQSTDRYKTVQAPERFDSLFPVLHRELGDSFYAVPQRTPSLAHVVRPGETIPEGVSADVMPFKIYAYAQVIEDPSRPTAHFDWVGNGVARIQANLTRSDLITLQVPWFAGWKAWVGNRPISDSADGLGFQVLRPECDGPCEMTIRWMGRPDHIPSAMVSLAALGFLLVLVWRNPTWGKAESRAVSFGTAL